MKRLIACLAIVTITSMPLSPARAQFGYGVATETTQLINMAQLLLQVWEQYKTYYELYKQYQNMLTNTEAWKDFYLSKGKDMLKDLAKTVEKDRVIAYTAADISKDLDYVYPGYTDYLGVSPEDWKPEYISDLYKDWTKGHRNNIVAALEAANIHQEEFDNEEIVLDGLSLQMESAVGRNQSLQTSNQIALEGLQQNRKVRQLLMTQIQLQTNHMAYQAEREDAEQAYRQKLQESITRRSGMIDINDGEGF